MTTIIVLSDTHRSLAYKPLIQDMLKQEAPDLVFHLGDDYCDGEWVTELGIPLIQVPGTRCPQYESPYVDNRRFEEVEGTTFFLTHTPEPDWADREDDINPLKVIDNQACDIFLHGHTHKPEIIEKNNMIIFNPGHLKKGDRRGYQPSYGKITLGSGSRNYTILTLFEHQVVAEVAAASVD